MPRLPLPGMLRDGPAPRSADFREAPRARSGPSTVAAMAPPKGVIAPPRRGTPEEDEQSRLKPGDTAAFMAEVAAELMQEDAQGSTIHGVAVEIMDDEEAGAQMSAAGLSLPPNAPAATSLKATGPTKLATPATVPADAPSKRRGVLLGLGITTGVGLLLLLWFGLRESPKEPTPLEKNAAADEPRTPGDRTSDAAPTGLLADGATPADASTGPEVGAAAIHDAHPTTGAFAGSAGQSGSASTTGGETDDATGSDTTGGDTTTGDPTGTTAAPTDDGAEPVASASNPRSSSRPRSRGKKDRPKPTPTSKPKPTPKPKPEAPPDASALLTQARAAYNGGRHSSAFALASRSHRARKTSEAAELMTLAACGMSNSGKAKAALKKVALLRRGSVRSKCKSKHGVKLGI